MQPLTAPPFLDGIPLRNISLPGNHSLKPIGLALGNGPSALEVVVCTASVEPTRQIMRSVWKARNAGRPAPLLLVVIHGEKAALCGPAGEEPPATLNLDLGQVDRLCREALGQADRHAAQRALRDSLPALVSELGGIRNNGFLATHELVAGVPRRNDWKEANQKGKKVLSHTGEKLLKALGYQLEPCDSVTSILKSGDKKTALAILLRESESTDLKSERFANLTPISYALAVADRENLPYVLVTQGQKVRIYPAKVGVGVGRRGRTETYLECHTGLIRDSEAGFLWLLFSADAVTEEGSLKELIQESARFAGDLAANLRDRIYGRVIPILAEGIVKARGLKKPTAQDESQTYEMAMTILFRLLFIAYAEDKDLLPYKWNDLYRSRSLKSKAQEIIKLINSDTAFGAGDSYWSELLGLFKAVDEGNKEWGVPAYNGGLFSTEKDVSPVGHLVTQLSLPNSVIGPVLQDLLLTATTEGIGPVDFRSLGVTEFGTVYEGLLESELSVAEQDLSVDDKGHYRPCKAGEKPIVRKGAIYLHNRSGARKALGTYFTKTFAVEYLLEHALEPALLKHHERLDKMTEEEAAEQLFDFRIADIAMGSGHFLVGAVDHIERSLSGYLAKRKLPGAYDELNAIRNAALTELGSLADQVEIEDTQLLRRLIARRCVYGTDINPVAVQLARLAIWIHTFVPGLPLSLLDHNLVCGNSLIGIGRLSEVSDKLENKQFLADNKSIQLEISAIDATQLIGNAAEPLKRLAKITDSTPADIKRARKACEEAIKATDPASALCDIVTACRIQGTPVPIKVEDWKSIKKTLHDSQHHKEALTVISDLQPFHFPIAFPEVFLRQRNGFDVILGNPPWEEATVEEDAFWARHFPGLRSKPQREQEQLKGQLRMERPDLTALYEKSVKNAETMRKALTCGVYPGMGTGDPDSYKAFCWRFWQLLSDDGRLGVVLPRSAFAAKGSADFRTKIFTYSKSVDITFLLNNKQWVFDEVHPQYTIGLASMHKPQTQERISVGNKTAELAGTNLVSEDHSSYSTNASQSPMASHNCTVSLKGPFRSLVHFKDGAASKAASFDGREILTWNDEAALPLLPSDNSIEVFSQLRKSPRLDLNKMSSWRTRPYREIDATNDKKYLDLKSLDCPDGFWPVFKGESFDIWIPDTGSYYAWANPEILLPVLQKKRIRAANTKTSAFAEFRQSWREDPATLPCLKARIAFRDVTRATDTRTMRVALVPPNVFLVNTAPHLLWCRGDEKDEAFLLGVLSSLCLDWYARRFVEIHMNYFVFNPLPIPRPASGQSSLYGRVVELAGRLACPDARFAEWGHAVGVDIGSLSEDEKEDAINELDAVVAHLYGLSQKQLEHVFETFHEGWDYTTRLKDTVKHYKTWKEKS